MITYTPKTPLEAAVLESGRFEFATDSAGREVVCVGHRRLPPVVLQMKSEGMQELIETAGADGGTAFRATEGDPWQIENDEPDETLFTTAAEEYLVMGVRPMKVSGRPLRVAVRRSVTRLFLVPWEIPATEILFGDHAHFAVTSTRGVAGEWSAIEDARRGVVVGVPEMWVGVLERVCKPGAELVFRCDVPIPWVDESGLANAAPTTIGIFEASPDQASDEEGPGALSDETWIAKLPIVMSEGNVVHPVDVPDDVSVDDVRDGPWEREWQGSSEFDLQDLS
ncbi:MAG: hypothetical protein ACYDEP_09300 [Acidimicrobiales bacterium]